MIHDPDDLRATANGETIPDDDEASGHGGTSLKYLGTISVRMDVIQGLIKKPSRRMTSIQLPGDVPISEKVKKAGSHAVRSASH